MLTIATRKPYHIDGKTYRKSLYNTNNTTRQKPRYNAPRINDYITVNSMIW